MAQTPWSGYSAQPPPMPAPGHGQAPQQGQHCPTMNPAPRANQGPGNFPQPTPGQQQGQQHYPQHFPQQWQGYPQVQPNPHPHGTVYYPYQPPPQVQPPPTEASSRRKVRRQRQPDSPEEPAPRSNALHNFVVNMQSTVTTLQQQLRQSQEQGNQLRSRLEESNAQNEELRAQQVATCKSRPPSRGRQDPSRSPIKRRLIHSHSPPSRRRRVDSRSPSPRRHRRPSRHAPEDSRTDTTYRRTTLYAVTGGNLPIGAHPQDRTDTAPVIYITRPPQDSTQPQQRTTPAGQAIAIRPSTEPDAEMTDPQPDSLTAETLPPLATRGVAVLRQGLTLEEYQDLDNDNPQRPEADQERTTTSSSSRTTLTELEKQYWYWENWRRAMNAKHTRHTHELAVNLSVAKQTTVEKQLSYAKSQRSNASTNTRRIQRQITQLLTQRRSRQPPQQGADMEVEQSAMASTEQQDDDHAMEVKESPQNAAEQTDTPPPNTPRRREQRSDSSSS